MIAAYLLDIEGTTTPIEFVTEVLFPYSTSEIEAVETGLSPKTYAAEDLEALWAEFLADAPGIQALSGWNKPTDFVGASRYLLALIQQDRKSTALKSIQGKIWESGYRSGRLRGEVYGDVIPAMRRWRDSGAKVAIYSSGSVLAQKLLFGHLREGDVTGLIDAHFDTTTGSKREPMSYVLIANALGLAVSQILFLSDLEAEVEAACSVGMKAMRVDRSGREHGANLVHDFSGL